MHYVNDIAYETKEEADAAFAAILAAEAELRIQEAEEEAAYEAGRPLTAQEVLTVMLASTDVAESLPDEALARMAPYFSEWEAEVDYTSGEIVAYETHTYRCLQQHQSQDGWEPDGAVSLWAQILPGQDGTEVGEWVQPDSTNPYMTGDRVTHNGSTWESVVDNNVWEPGVYGWQEVPA